MVPILLYLLKMTICSGVLYVYYLLFLKDKTFHHYNRFYLLFTVIVSLLLPLIKVSYFTIELNPNFYLLFSQINNQNLEKVQSYDINYYSIIYSVIGLVSVFLLMKLLFSLIRIKQMRKAFPKEALNGINFYQTNLENAPFSFFRNLFWKQSIEINSEVGKQILKHEMVHIEQKHSWDKLLMQFVKSMVWFNPIFYLINSEINLIHEYLADNKAVEKSDTKAFAQMLLGSHFSGQILPATSPFLSSNLKKRLKMLTKSTTKYSYARKFFALPILFVIVFAYLVDAKNKEIIASNKAIELAVEQQELDTVKPKVEVVANAVTSRDLSDSDILEKAKNTSNKALFIIKGNEVSKQEFLKYASENKNKDLFLGYSTASIQSDKEHLVFGEREKEGVFFADIMGEINESSGEYHQLIKKLNPVWYNNQILHNKYGAKEVEKKNKEIEAKVNSPEFKERIALAERKAKEVEAKINSPEFQKRIAEAEKRSNAIVDDRIYIAADRIKFSKELTPKEKRQLERKQKELQKKKADYDKLRQELLDNPIVGTLDKKQDDFSSRYSIVPKDTKRFSASTNALSDSKIFVDGKEISKKEMDSIKPETIKRIFVEKSENGKGIIKIETK